MSTAAAVPNRLVLADLVPGALARDVALVVGGAGLTGLAAQVAIHTPLSPVPFTLQTMAVLVSGVSAFGGLLLSYHLAISSGASIVLCSALCFAVSLGIGRRPIKLGR